MRLGAREVFPLLLSVWLLSGCYEDNVKIKQWAIDRSAEYFFALVGNDAKVRVSKVAAKAVPEFDKEMSSLSATFTKVVGEHLAVVSEMPDSKATDVESLSRLHRKWTDEYFARNHRFVALRAAIKSLQDRFGSFSRLCSEYFETYAVPPVDVAAMAAAGGKDSFGVYLSVGYSFGGGSGNGQVSMNFADYRNKNFVEKLQYDCVEKPLSDLFSSDEARNALKEAQKIMEGKAPSAVERKVLARAACNEVFSEPEAISKAFLATLAVMDANIANLERRVIVKPAETLLALKQALQARYEQGLEDAAERRRHDEEMYRRGDQIVGYLAEIRAAVLRAKVAMIKRDCTGAVDAHLIAKSALKGLRDYMTADDPDNYLETVEYFESQVSTFERDLYKAGACARV